MRPFSKMLRMLCVVSLLCVYQVARAGSEGLDMSGRMIITIDGGSATKKSPVSQAIAEKFNLVYFESGALYRVVVDALIRAGIEADIENEERVAEFLGQAKYELYLDGRVVKLVIDDVRLTPRELRSEEINSKVAEYSSLFKSISDFCIQRAREIIDLKEFCEFDGIIAEGRTCGVYMFPEADLKFWFYATEDAKLNFRLNVEKEKDDPLKRDQLDFSRKFYPMTQPDDAILIWTSSRSTESNIGLVTAFVEQKVDLKKHLK